MASIGSLVVNFTSSTIGLEQGIRKTSGMLQAFGRRVLSMRGALTAAFAGAGVGGLVKMAADAETLQMQLKVLTGSAEAASKLMQELQAFAVSTPFESMDIAGAARSLIAFGTPAENVIEQLTTIGDIASGVGVPLGEMAELYGKMQVQGRVFAEDINQLTGRGIPIIQALAAQFGVMDSEVKKLVESGAVGFAEVSAAMKSMAGPGGKFQGLMEQLSTTTAGKFSTFKDNLQIFGRILGEMLLPLANQFLDWAIALGPTLIQVGKVLSIMASNMGTTFAAAFESLRGWAGSTFSFLAESAVVVAQNVAIQVMNVFEELRVFMQNLGEDLAAILGLSDEAMRFTAQRKATIAMPQFQAPQLGQAQQALANMLEAVFQPEQMVAAGRGGAAATSSAIETQSAAMVANERKTVGAMERGSAEAYSAIIAAQRQDPNVDATKQQTKALLQPLKQMVFGLGNLSTGVVIENFAGAQ